MANEKYNGWTNFDTWLVMLWLYNDEKNYTAIKNLYHGIGSAYKLKDLKCCNLMAIIRRYHYGDKINWHKVNMDEIKTALLNDFEGND